MGRRAVVDDLEGGAPGIHVPHAPATGSYPDTEVIWSSPDIGNLPYGWRREKFPTTAYATLEQADRLPVRNTLAKRDFGQFRLAALPRAFAVSANGEKMLYQQGPAWTIAPTAGPPEPGKGVVKVDAMETYVDPRAEWRQMYHDVWRSERDFFYDPNHHGLDLAAAERFYEPYVASIAHRADLNYLFREMLNQLSVGHMFVGGGDVPRPGAVPGGLLGCDFEIANDRYRFTRVFNGENWNPQLVAPLTQPGVNVAAGEYLLAVNGRDLRASANVYQAFENTAGKQVVIKVGPNPDGTGSRDVTVVPVPSETGLRHLAWIEGNRRKVSQLSGGKLAYVYVPNTSTGGFTSFNRYFFAQTDKDGAVIDERFNGGGLLADYIVGYLTRPQLAQIHFRYGTQDIKVPGGAIYGPKVMLINELAGSGGDALPCWTAGTGEIAPSMPRQHPAPPAYSMRAVVVLRRTGRKSLP